VPFDHVAAEQAFETGNVMRVGHGDVQTRVLVRLLPTRPRDRHSLLTLLPEVLHLAAGSGHRGIDDTVRLLAVELSDPQLATPTVLNRLVDILLIQLIRSWVSSISREVQPSWLKGLGDPVVAGGDERDACSPRAGLDHREPGGEVAVSRATWPGALPRAWGSRRRLPDRWRMDLAARALRDTDHPLEVLARSVGYTSEYAFSRAFSRARSVPPGRYRRQWRQMDERDA
jgi:hypothetical protein